MYETKDSESNATKYATTVERKSERELVVTRTFNGPAHIVFDAWTKPELLQRWWVAKSCGVSFSCEADVRTGASTVSCSVTLPQSSRCHSLAGTSK
jgi:uncharacterized protein YndB with AHSA1/START domain